MLEHRLSERHYTSVANFSADLTAVIAPVLARLAGSQDDTSIRDITDLHEQLNGVAPGTAQHLALSHEQKELKKVTKRIAKAVKEMLDVARKKEAELKGIPFEKEMDEWAAFDARLEKSIKSSLPSAPSGDQSNKLPVDAPGSVVGGASPGLRDNGALLDEDTVMGDVDIAIDMGDVVKNAEHASNSSALLTDNSSTATVDATRGLKGQRTHPLSPPSSTSSVPHDARHATTDATATFTAESVSLPAASIDDPWARGGIPWYLEAFDISGTTVHDERWTGKRAMSEALSEMDEETLLDVLEQSGNGVADHDSNVTPAPEQPRRTTRGNVAAEAQDVEQTEEQRLLREKKDKANAKRRAQRRRNKW